MSRMSDLDIEIRQAEQDGRKYFATTLDPMMAPDADRTWVVFDVETAKRVPSGVAFLRYDNDDIITFSSEYWARIASGEDRFA